MLDTLAFYATLLHRDFAAYTARRLQEEGLTFGGMFPLLYVGKHPRCTQGELTAALGLDWGYAQRTVIRLAEEGFLLREKEGRAWRLTLSPKGQEAFRTSHQVFWDWDRETLAPLTREERDLLFSLLQKTTKKEGNLPPCTKHSPAP